MKPDQPRGSMRATVGPHAGAIIRAARLAAGLTLAELGQRCGYSASQISRYERGVQRLTDITLLHRFSEVLLISPQSLGLTPLNNIQYGRHADSGPIAERTPGPNLGRKFQPEDGDDPVRRRELLARAAGLAGVAALGLPATPRLQANADPRGHLDNLLYGGASAQPVSLATLRTITAQARASFQTARYDRLAAMLPRIVRPPLPRVTVPAARTGSANALLADAYIVAADFAVKLNDDPVAWTLADRALQAAQAGDDSLTTADARRAVATVLRRTGRPAGLGSC